MHMQMLIGGGVVLLGVFLLFGKLWGVPQPDFAVAAKLFIPVWLVVSVTNMAVGVVRAGYTVTQELPIFLLVFVVPALLACGVVWRTAPWPFAPRLRRRGFPKGMGGRTIGEV